MDAARPSKQQMSAVFGYSESAKQSVIDDAVILPVDGDIELQSLSSDSSERDSDGDGDSNDSA
jgi:hypothetical protein